MSKQFISRRQAGRLLVGFLCAGTLIACETLPEDSIVPFKEDDNPLSLKVKQALQDSPQTANLRFISVQSKGDVVTLSGTVNNRTDVSVAEQVATSVDGVRHVVNQLYLR